jgi:sterol desaturase/sphingolipid hydroxylase (fatty acid hydroxylase superfamily)
VPDEALTHEPWIRAVVFVTACVVLLVAEALVPRRPRRPRAWPNWYLLLTDTAVVRLVSASSVVGVAAWAETRQLGILNAVSSSGASAFAVGFVLLDLGIYVQHRLLHRFAWLWRLHRVHHSDTDFDFSTGVRFHPGEILFSFAWKVGMVIVLGATPWTVLAFEASLSTASLFTHANLRLPARVDAALRKLVVTPEMHRVHHSVDPDEHNRNFGFLLICWDRWFGTYRARPRAAPESMTIGLEHFRESAQQRLGALLVQPFAAERTVQ